MKSYNLCVKEDYLCLNYKNNNNFYYVNAYSSYYVNIDGRLHRLDGPAVEYKNGRKYYYIDHIPYWEDAYWEHPQVIQYKYLKEHPELEGFI